MQRLVSGARAAHSHTKSVCSFRLTGAPRRRLVRSLACCDKEDTRTHAGATSERVSLSLTHDEHNEQALVVCEKTTTASSAAPIGLSVSYLSERLCVCVSISDSLARSDSASHLIGLICGSATHKARNYNGYTDFLRPPFGYYWQHFSAEHFGAVDVTFVCRKSCGGGDKTKKTKTKKTQRQSARARAQHI